jgi:hypothetical protein
MKLHEQEISVVNRVPCFLLAVYLFNFSIDSRDAHPDSVAEDLSINDIESVYEFLTEHVLGIENAVEEHDERDQDDGGSFEFKKFFLSFRISVVQVKDANILYAFQALSCYKERLTVRFLEKNSPPP